MCPTECPGRLEIVADNVSFELHNFYSRIIHRFIPSFHTHWIFRIAFHKSRGKNYTKWRDKRERKLWIQWRGTIFLAEVPFSGRNTGAFSMLSVLCECVNSPVVGEKQLIMVHTLSFDNGINKSNDMREAICNKLMGESVPFCRSQSFNDLLFIPLIAVLISWCGQFGEQLFFITVIIIINSLNHLHVHKVINKTIYRDRYYEIDSL